MWRLILAVLVPLLIGGRGAADEAPGQEAIKEAITLLEARKAQADERGDKDQIAKAIGELQKLLAKPKAGHEAGAEVDLAKVLTPAALKKKFAGRAAFNPKTGELTLVYDFTTREQLKDFELGDAKLVAMSRGTVGLEAATEIKHVVEFQTLTVTGVVAGGRDVDVRTTSKVRLYGHGSIVVDGQGVQDDIGGFTPRVPAPFKLTISPKRVAMEMGGKKGALERNVPVAGQLILGGGAGGVQYSRLTMTGTVVDEWAVKFFK